MAVTNYYSVGGEIIGERMAGGSRTDYLTDALGNVTATLNQSAQVVNTYRYKPYGGLLAKTGTGADPSFGWNGTHGYRPTAKKFSDFYVRARHYESTTGRWTTADPYFLRPWRGSYSYANASPVLLIDASGMICFNPDCCTKALGDAAHDPANKHCKGGEWGEIPNFTPENFTKPCDDKGTCTAIVASLDFVADICSSMCKKATQKGGGSYNPNAQWDAMTICCLQPPTNTPKFCGILWCSKQGKPFNQDPCVIKCLIEHEMRHSQQPLFNCLGSISMPKGIQNPEAWAECDAYNTQLQCLLNAAKKKNCDLTKLKGKIDACIKSATFN